jgi:triosephosphate isomerase
MPRPKHLVVGNWKMYVDSLTKAKELSTKVMRVAARLKRTQAVICPPLPFLGTLAPSITRSKVFLGAQTVSAELEPARTGEVSMYMLKSVGVSHVIIGHSERRALGETDASVALKVIRSLKSGLTPIICIGEQQRDMRGDYLAFLEAQIRSSLADVPKARAKELVIAYEPLWAIGGSSIDAVTPAILHETVLFIKKILVSLYGRASGTSIRILYGGSVEEANAASLIAGGMVDGLLVGHASVDAEEFSEILRSVDKR